MKCMKEFLPHKLLILLLFFPIQTLSGQVERANIVIIYTDDQGYGDVSALNAGSVFQTPHMDRLANEGMVFTDGHSGSTVCTPSRYGLLTGRYSWRTSLKKGVLGADGPCLIPDDRITIASMLRQHGYHTAMVGKWHLNMQFPGVKGHRDWSQPVIDGPTEKGFAYFFGLPASMNFGLLTYVENSQVLEIPSMWTRKKIVQEPYRFTTPKSYRMMPPYEDTMQSDSDIEVAPSFIDEEVLSIFTQKTIQYIDRMASGSGQKDPFFLYFSLTSPHLPHSVHPDFRGLSNCGTYGDFMMETDHRIGELLNALDRNGLTENTIVILTSDNGAENNYKDHAKAFNHYSSHRFRGGKRDLYEGGHRVPFIVRWPAGIKAGSRCDQMVCQTYFLATFADLLDIPLPANAGEDSYSMLPYWLGTTGGSPGRNHLVHQSGAG